MKGKTMSDKLFSVAGVSTLNGETKARFANDVMRIKVLRKNNHENILLVELPREMTKLEAAEFIRTLPEFDAPEAQEAIDEAIGKRATKVQRKPAAKAPVVTKPKSKEAKVEAKGVDLDSLDDAPF
jgi:hypothetical protein